MLTNYFRSDHLQVTGFERVERYEDLELGDIVAYSMGRYTKPSDSSSSPHFDPDSRKNQRGEYTLPPRSPYPKAKAGGVGAGTAWFVLDKKGRALQRRLGPDSEYFDVVIGAARLRKTITLAPEILDLGFEGTDSVHSLQIGQKVHRCGTWGGLGSKAEFIDPHFTGRGMLELTAESGDSPCAP